MTRVAAIIPTYNREHCIARAIESVLSQTYENVECIVVDDGSTDGTRAIVEGFGPAVRYIQQDNAGQGPARNRGVASTDAEWIAFLDSDDAWLPQKIERQLHCVQECGADVSFTDFSLKRNLDGEGYSSWVDEVQQRNRQRSLKPGLLSSPLQVVVGPGDVVFTSTVMLRRVTFESARGYEPAFRRCQDVELHLRLALRASWCYFPEALTKKDWGANASVEKTYFYRSAALRSAWACADSSGDTTSTRLLVHALRFEYRALAGYRRQQGQLLGAARAAVGMLCPIMTASKVSDLQRRAALLR